MNTVEAQMKQERKTAQEGAIDLCRMFLWTGFSVLIGTPLTILMAHTLGISRSEAVMTSLVWLLMPVIIYMFDFMIILPLAERCVRRD